jgi:hypothetical protein
MKFKVIKENKAISKCNLKFQKKNKNIIKFFVLSNNIINKFDDFKNIR